MPIHIRQFLVIECDSEHGHEAKETAEAISTRGYAACFSRCMSWKKRIVSRNG